MIEHHCTPEGECFCMYDQGTEMLPVSVATYAELVTARERWRDALLRTFFFAALVCLWGFFWLAMHDAPWWQGAPLLGGLCGFSAGLVALPLRTDPKP